MIRFLNVLALVALIGSATWAYSVKYETILVAEKLRKREAELQRERDAIAILKAEWHLLNRPERLQLLAKPEIGMQPMSARQVVEAKDVPIAPVRTDKIDDLLTGSISTPDSASKTTKSTKGTTTASVALPGAARPKPATTTPAAKPGQAKKTPDKAKTPPKVATGAPSRLTPPAPVGNPAQPPAQRSESGGLTGFLKKLIR